MGQSLALSQWDTPLTVGQMGRVGQMRRLGQMRQRRSAVCPTVSVAVLSAVSRALRFRCAAAAEKGRAMVLRCASSIGGRDSVMTQPDTVVPPGSPSKAALRMRRHRERRKNSLRCLVIELRETEVTSLIRQGFLKD